MHPTATPNLGLALTLAIPLSLSRPGEAAGGQDSLPRLEVIAWQSALESRGFSPGLLDGLSGLKTAAALRAFQMASGLPVTGRFDEATALALDLRADQATEAYTVTAEDEKEVGLCPTDWLERSRLKRLSYATLSSLIAEKFHTSERCLAYLNPRLDLSSLGPGERLVVPASRLREPARLVKAIEIDLERKLVLILDEQGALKGLLHCSVARDLSAVARGSCLVASAVEDPVYTFDPKMWPEVTGIDRKLQIPPGPRSPVGVRWIGLDRPGVGIHGTPEPENIGKTGSHGCFRLTNWDAVFLASTVTVGTRVVIVDRSALADALVEPAPAPEKAAHDAPP